MKYAQELYENGLITYMRTDNKKYSKDFIKEIQKYIYKIYQDKKYINENNNNIVIDNQNDQPHEAIRPVNINITVSDIKDKIDAKSKKLYNIIWKRTMESCMSPCIYNYIVAEITAIEGIYRHRAEQIIFLGWKIIDKKENEDINPIYSYLLSLKKGIKMEYKKIISTVTYKNSILHYTEAKLVQLLEEMGIGRPSTFSSLVEKIQERKYVVKENIKGKIIKCKEFILEDENLTETIVDKEFCNEKNKLVIQPLGIAVMEFLIKNFDSIFNYKYTNIYLLFYCRIS
jgi:DNA topoisomerase-1